ncbi:MAG: WD40 repeat domain-containing protein [Gemmataceae bacterium]
MNAKLAERFQPKDVKVVKPDRQLSIVRFSPCGKVLAAGGNDASIRRWNVDDWSDLPALQGHHGWVGALAFAPAGNVLYSADSWGMLCAWNYLDKEAKPLWTVKEAHNGWARCVAVSADGKFLATCGLDRAVRIWDAATGKKIQDLSGHDTDVFAVDFHPDGKSLISGDLKGVVKQWELPAGKVTRSFDGSIFYRLSRLQEVGGVRRLEFDKTGKFFACAGTAPKSGGNVQGTPTILVFDFASGKLQHTIQVGADGDAFVYDLHLHPEGFVLAVTSGNPGTGKFFLHELTADKPFFLSTKMPNCHSLAMHPDGNRLVVAATNAGSNGNGRNLKNNEYPGNYSPLFVMELTGQEKAKKSS